jgi:hypothetical protein
MESIAVRIPTKAIIPTAIIRMVNIVLKGLERMAPKEMRKFSARRATFFIFTFLTFQR